MAIFISAGHHKTDPGAQANGFKESELTIEARAEVTKALDMMGVKYVTDIDTETLGMYLRRIQTGSGSVVLELHFDAASNPAANGCTAIVGTDADRLDKAFAKDIAKATSELLAISNRGVINESQSNRGRLGLMREQGTVSLLEIGFVTNKGDIAAFKANKSCWGMAIALILKKYEDMV